MPRTDQRHGFSVPNRISLLESDVDELNQHLTDLAGELRNIRNVLIGILISVTTASILLAINAGLTQIRH